jgi:hypothetical protein
MRSAHAHWFAHRRDMPLAVRRGAVSAPPRRMPTPGAMAARWLGVVAVAVVCLVSGCGSSSTNGSGPPVSGVISNSLGAMAGYVFEGHIHSVAGAWLVPAIERGSKDGHACTWIGAQAPGPSGDGPFVQVGITEDRVGPLVLGTHESVYSAFWSASALDFHPVNLFVVKPGDHVSASLRLESGGWHVSITDTTNGMRKAFVTQHDVKGAFNLAEWLQEDPTKDSGAREPYPRIRPVSFTGLTVDGVSPRYSDLDSQWMSVNRSDLAPTPLVGNEFSLENTALSPAGVRYYAIAKRGDQVQEKFQGDVLGATAPGAGQGEVATALRSLDGYTGELARSHWPTEAASAVANLVTKGRTLAVVVRSAERPGWKDDAAWQARFKSAELTLSVQAHLVRRLLHVPEIGTATPGTRAS